MKHTYIELKTQSCYNVGVQLIESGLKSDLDFIKQNKGSVSNVYLDSKRAKEIAFKLLSLSRKLDSKKK